MFYGLDAHKEFIQVCQLSKDEQRRREFRVGATPEAISSFASRLTDDDQVALEATFHTWAIHAILVEHAGRVVVVNPMQVKAIAHARIKTDKVDAHILAQLLRADFLPEVQLPDEKTWACRQLVTHRVGLIKQRTAVKNSVRALLNRRLMRCPYRELFCKKGRAWLRQLQLGAGEQFILENTLALLDELDARVEAVDIELKTIASVEEQAKLLMTIPGVDVTVAIGMLSAIGDIARFQSSGQLAAYFGLVPRVKQSAGTIHHGSITKSGRSTARWLAVEAAHHIALSSAPLAATFHRIKRKKGHNVAVTALARKLVVLIWHMLKNGEPYRYASVTRTRAKLASLRPNRQRAKPGTVPQTIEGVYVEAGLPVPPAPSLGEKRAASSNRRTITCAKKRSAPKSRPLQKSLTNP